jgi:hypothetical protein
MLLEDLGNWYDTWSEELYKRDYECLPSFMEDALYEYFENGGTDIKFSKKYTFNKETTELVTDLYNEYLKKSNG